MILTNSLRKFLPKFFLFLAILHCGISLGSESRIKRKQRERASLRALFQDLFDLEDWLYSSQSPKARNRGNLDGQKLKTLAKTSADIDHIGRRLQPQLRQNIELAWSEFKNRCDLTTTSWQQKRILLSNLKSEIIANFRVDISPATPPNLNLGKDLFLTHCSSCHGAQGAGDGSLAHKLPSHPRNLNSQFFLAQNSPLRVFNTLVLGKEDKGMPAYEGNMSPHELWSLSFFVMTLRGVKSPSAKATVAATKLTLEILASKNDHELSQWLMEQDPDLSDKNKILESLISSFRRDPKMISTLIRG